MTVAADPVAPTSSQLLYVAIDLGGQPLLSDYSDQVTHLNNLVVYCSTMALNRPPGTRIMFSRTVVVRTSLASPWATVLGSVADKSVPIAYAMAALFSLRQMLGMIQDWQTHRQNLSERRQAMPRGRHGVEDDLAIDDILTRHEASQGDRAVSDMARPTRPGAAIANLGRVVTAEMINPDDPRATG